MDVYRGPVNFNAEVIKTNKIKSIVLDIVDKPDGTVIIDKDATQGFEFDENGRIVRYYYTVLSKVLQQEIEVPAIKRHGKIIRPASTRIETNYINDTIFSNLFYDAAGRVICRRMRSGDYYDAFYYEYNDGGQIKKEMHCKETNVSENKNEFKLGVQSILSSETFVYESLTSTQLKKKCLNDEGREYKMAILNYDEKGNLLSEAFDFIVSWMHQENAYEYNTSGNLTRRIFKSNESGEMKLESTYEYDAAGLLLSEKKLNGAEVQNEISYLFDDTTKLVKSHLNRDFKNASIGIVKYAYTYY